MNIVRNINKNIFREYDIRGVYPIDIDEDVSYTIGKAYGTYIKKLGENMCLVGHDNRISSSTINHALTEGILSTGVDVIDLGLVTTPMLYYARMLKKINAGIMVTASHNPKDDNGFKFSFSEIGNAKGEEIFKFRDFVINNAFDEGKGTLFRYSIIEEYYNLIKNNLNFGNRRLKVVLDCGNGTTSVFAKELYSKFPIDLVMLYDESDGNFPNHHPDPIVEENVRDLKKKVLEEKADVGIGFDGDGDRAGFIYENGEMMTSDFYAIVILRELLKNNSNKNALYDIKCSKIVKDEILKLGGIPHENRTGASYMMDTVMKDNMLFGVEYSGHIYFNNNFPPITSGLYAGLKLLEIMSKSDKKLSDMVKGVNKYYATPELKFAFSDDTKYLVIDEIKKYCNLKGYKMSLIDGVKVYFDDGWALVRCSNTGPNVTARFEASTEKRLEEIKEEFLSVVEKCR
ncbi:MAG: phosphomannomutase/phosphoglucomutase [Bacilli bacterium]|nr:phosphomannomutase/phosphoglucomutase [Bacilli bacterium]